MQYIRSEKDIHNLLMKQLGQFTAQVSIQIKKLIKEFIEVYYAEYTPSSYHRTEAFLNSVTSSEVKRKKNGYEVEIFLDSPVSAYKIDPQLVWESANMGLHGGYTLPDGTPSDNHFWDDAMEELRSGYLVEEFGDFMAKKGFIIIRK